MPHLQGLAAGIPSENSAAEIPSGAPPVVDLQELRNLRLKLESSQQRFLEFKVESADKLARETKAKREVQEELERLRYKAMTSQNGFVEEPAQSMVQKSEQRQAMRHHYTMLHAESEIQTLNDEHKAANKRLKKIEKENAVVRQGEEVAAELAAEQLKVLRSENTSMQQQLERLESSVVDKTAALHSQLGASEQREQSTSQNIAAELRVSQSELAATETRLCDIETHAEDKVSEYQRQLGTMEMNSRASAEAAAEGLKALRTEAMDSRVSAEAAAKELTALRTELSERRARSSHRDEASESSSTLNLAASGQLSPQLVLDSPSAPSGSAKLESVIHGHNPEALDYAILVAERDGLPGTVVEKAKKKLSQMKKETLWSYEPVNFQRLQLLELPRFGSPVSIYTLVPGDVFQVIETEAATDDAQFLRLADGRGWAIDRDIVVESGLLKKMAPKEDCFISCVCHEELLVTCSADGMARLWDLQGGLNEAEHETFNARAKEKVSASKATAKAKPKAGSKAAPKAKAKAKAGDAAEAVEAVIQIQESTKPTYPTGKELRQFLHNGKVNCGFAMGRQLATGSGDSCARTWDLHSGTELCQFNHPDTVWSVCIYGRHLATGSADNLARLWNMDSGEEIRHFQHDGEVRSVYLFGEELATGSSDNLARIWNIKSAEQPMLFQHDGWVLSVHFIGQHLVTGSADKLARLWDLTSGEELHRFEHLAEVNTVFIDKIGKTFATGSDDSRARVYDLDTFDEINSFQHEKPVTSVCITGEKLVTAASDKQARVWDIERGEIVRCFHHLDRVHNVFVPADVPAIEIPGNTAPVSSHPGSPSPFSPTPGLSLSPSRAVVAEPSIAEEASLAAQEQA
jgi:WD40 repeat protein